MRTIRSVSRIALGFLLSCTGGNDRTPILTVRDSGSIRIATFDTAAHSVVPRWTVAPEPDLHIANREDDPRYQFFFVTDALFVPAGIAVAASGSNDVRIFDESGEYVRTIGGPGEGPGEFGSVDWLQRLGPDTIAVYDRGQRRISVFDVGGRLLRDVAIHRTPASLDRDAMQGPQPRGLLPDGSILVALYEAPAQLDGPSRPAVFLHAYASDGTPGDSLASALGDDIFILPLGNGRAAVARPPFPRITMFHVARDGFWVADNDAWELRRYDANGALRTIVHRVEDGIEITPALLDVYVEAQIAGYPAGPRREEARRDAMTMAFHRIAPAFAGAWVGEDGRVWIRDYAVPQDAGEMWSVFTPNGSLDARVRLPARLRVLRFSATHVLGVLKDDFDRETIARYRLERVR